MKKSLWSVCALVLLLTLSSCGGKTLIDDFIGKWEISSKDDVDEDGLSLEFILELKEGHEFTETRTVYEEGEQTIVVTIDGEYGLQHTQEGNCLWRRYNLESLQVYSDDTIEDLENDFIQDYYNENTKLEKAEEAGDTFGLQKVRVIKGSELSWETDEPLFDDSGRNFGSYKREKAKAIL